MDDLRFLAVHFYIWEPAVADPDAYFAEIDPDSGRPRWTQYASKERDFRRKVRKAHTFLLTDDPVENPLPRPPGKILLNHAALPGKYRKRRLYRVRKALKKRALQQQALQQAASQR